MKKALVFVSLVAVALMLPLLPAFSQPDPPAFIDDSFTSPQRPPARFDHDTHMEASGVEDCYTCHHLYEEGKLVPEISSEDQRCVDCHAVKAPRGSTSLVNAYHRLCKTCHDQQKKGPLTCGECHSRSTVLE